MNDTDRGRSTVNGYIARVYGADGGMDDTVRYDVQLTGGRFVGKLESILPIRAIQSPIKIFRTARLLDPCAVTLVDGVADVRLVVFTEVFQAAEC